MVHGVVFKRFSETEPKNDIPFAPVREFEDAKAYTIKSRR
jgi:hypothetical protein